MHFSVFFLGLFRVPFLPHEDANTFQSSTTPQLQEELCCLPAVLALPNCDLVVPNQLPKPSWRSDTKPAWKPPQNPAVARAPRGREPQTGRTRPRQQVGVSSFRNDFNLISSRNVTSFAPHRCAAHNHLLYFASCCHSQPSRFFQQLLPCTLDGPGLAGRIIPHPVRAAGLNPCPYTERDLCPQLLQLSFREVTQTSRHLQVLFGYLQV